MRALSVWSLLALACVIGCGLSPGQDLPSASSDAESGDGDFLKPPGGDGDPIIVVPPSDSGGSCSSGGDGGMGGRAETGGGMDTGRGAAMSGECSSTVSDR